SLKFPEFRGAGSSFLQKDCSNPSYPLYVAIAVAAHTREVGLRTVDGHPALRRHLVGGRASCLHVAPLWASPLCVLVAGVALTAWLSTSIAPGEQAAGGDPGRLRSPL
ncbi:hypothetical protein BHE74_00023991, partial [Ensete ventricosum]